MTIQYLFSLLGNLKRSSAISLCPAYLESLLNIRLYRFDKFIMAETENEGDIG